MNSTENTEPLMVSIRCLTYNHEKYIRDTLEGFVMQQTNFRFEAIVHDDASTDGTAAIIREYAEKYPEIIKPIYEKENLYSKHDGSLRRVMNAACRGKYVAFCEGDDFWTDPLKLQKQVDFLESHPDYSMCSHRCDIYLQNKGVLKEDGFNKDCTYELETLISGHWLFQTLSVMYRQQLLSYNEVKEFKICWDAVKFWILLKKGPGYYISNRMGVYRIHGNGVWSGIDADKKKLSEFCLKLDIYNHEKTEEAARYLLNQFSKGLSRKWMIKNYTVIFQTARILIRHYGLIYTLNILFNKIIRGKRILLASR